MPGHRVSVIFEMFGAFFNSNFGSPAVTLGTLRMKLIAIFRSGGHKYDTSEQVGFLDRSLLRILFVPLKQVRKPQQRHSFPAKLHDARA